MPNELNSSYLARLPFVWHCCLFRLMATCGDSRRESRRQELDAEMNSVGLDEYKSYLFVGYDHDGTKNRLVNRFIHNGYPSAKEVSKSLAPFVRKNILKKEGWWIKDDSRCQDFITGVSTYPDAESLGNAIVQDRDIRRESLYRILSERGCPNPRDTLPELYGVEQAMKHYIDDGTGNADSLAGGIITSQRHAELKAELLPMNLASLLPRIEYRSIHNSGGNWSERISKVIQNPDCDPRIGAFLTELSTEVNKVLLCSELDAERRSRQALVDTSAAALNLDLSSLDRRHVYRYEGSTILSQIKVFVEQNVGDGAFLVAQLAEHTRKRRLGEILLKWKLPPSDDFIRKQPRMAERFNTCLSVGTEASFLELAEQLTSEQSDRHQELYAFFLSEDDLGQEPKQVALEDDGSSDMLLKSDFARYGVGNVSEDVEKVNISLRRNALEDAIKKARPRLMDPSLWSRNNYDSRCDEYCKAVGPWQNAKALVSLWQEEETFRRKEVNGILKEQGLGPITERNDIAYQARKRFEGFISQGNGSASKTANEIAKIMREDQITEQIRGDSAFTNSYWRLVSDPRYEAFISNADNAHCSVADFVDKLKLEKKSREESINRALEKIDMSAEEVAYEVKDELEAFARNGTGCLEWITSAALFFRRQKAIELEFGNLCLMIPSIYYFSIVEFRKELRSVTIQTILDVLYPAVEAESNLTINKGLSADGLRDETDPTLAHLVADYAEDFDDTVYSYCLEEQRDIRLAWLLAGREAGCPKEKAKRLAVILRSERKKRIYEIDELFPPLNFPSGRWHRTFNGKTEQDKEDDVFNDCGPRADFINDKISIEEAAKEITKTRRRQMLDEAFTGSHMVKNSRCQMFVEMQGMVGAEEALKTLVASLQSEREERCRLLEDAFIESGALDLGVGIDSLCGVYTAFDGDDNYDDHYVDHYSFDKESFPSEAKVCKGRSTYIDLGEGAPESVVHITVMHLRFVRLTPAVERHFFSWPPCKVESWIQQSQECKKFVSNVQAGPPTKEQIAAFLSEISEMPAKKLEKVPYDTEDDDCYGATDWKDHLSGGDYGNDPVCDARWDDYWDS